MPNKPIDLQEMLAVLKMKRVRAKTYRVNQRFNTGIVNEDSSIKQTGHKQVSIQYDQTLFRILDQSGRLLKEITVDEGIADLLVAVWKHGIPTTGSCQGGNGETAWIRFESDEDALHFDELVSHLSVEKWKFCKETKDLSFPPEDIEKIVEELNRLKPLRR